ncbi:MAG: hypothetical protein JNK82_39340 [Myxococcaceae bacterium]|nr:hypothetical protein [Myxococcaceae bacterium]
MDDAAKQRVLKAGAAAYAQAFGRVPPNEREALEHELDELATELRNAITAALWAHPYVTFVDAVRRALVKAV